MSSSIFDDLDRESSDLFGTDYYTEYNVKISGEEYRDKRWVSAKRVRFKTTSSPASKSSSEEESKQIVDKDGKEGGSLNSAELLAAQEAESSSPASKSSSEEEFKQIVDKDGEEGGSLNSAELLATQEAESSSPASKSSSEEESKQIVDKDGEEGGSLNSAELFVAQEARSSSAITEKLEGEKPKQTGESGGGSRDLSSRDFAVEPIMQKATSPSERLLTLAISREYAYGMLGLVLGLVSIIGGVILALNGVAGSTSWTAKLLALQSEINDAAPGVVLFIVGIFMIWITKPKVYLKDLQDD